MISHCIQVRVPFVVQKQRSTNLTHLRGSSGPRTHCSCTVCTRMAKHLTTHSGRSLRRSRRFLHVREGPLVPSFIAGADGTHTLSSSPFIDLTNRRTRVLQRRSTSSTIEVTSTNTNKLSCVLGRRYAPHLPFGEWEWVLRLDFRRKAYNGSD